VKGSSRSRGSHGVSSFHLARIDIGSKSALGQFSALDILALARGYTSKKLTADFVLNLQAINPNNGTAGAPRTTGTLSSLIPAGS
jgi:hypothetical protein